MWDPIAAYASLLHVPRYPVTLTCRATFTNAEDDEVQNLAPVEAVSEVVHQRTWLDRVDFSLQTNNQQGSPLGSLFQTSLKASPGLLTKVSVEPEPRYVVAGKMTPLENFVNGIADRWPRGWILYRTQFIRMIFTLTQEPGGGITPSNPYVVTVTFTGWQYIDPTVNKVDAGEARSLLRSMGLKVFQPKEKAWEGDARAR